MINPRLYAVLRHLYGDVRIHNEGQRPRLGKNASGKTITLERGEHYYLNCPMCGESRQRLVIGSSWLSKQDGRLVTGGAICLNERCPVYKKEFYSNVLRLLESPESLALEAPYRALPNKPVAPPRVWRLPYGFRLLDQLPSGHPALQFLAEKYTGLDPGYLAQCYGVGFTDEYDPEFRLASNRIIFPIWLKNQLTGWQGRTILKDEKVRWYLPSGFLKERGFYNQERVAAHQIPVLCEGITTSIAAGPTGLAMWGVNLNENQCRAIGERWRTCILALDPETQVADLRMKTPIKQAEVLKAKLDPFLAIPCRLIRYPANVMALAERKVRREDVKVPDLADFGPKFTRELIAQLPHPWNQLAVL